MRLSKSSDPFTCHTKIIIVLMVNTHLSTTKLSLFPSSSAFLSQIFMYKLFHLGIYNLTLEDLERWFITRVSNTINGCFLNNTLISLSLNIKSLMITVAVTIAIIKVFEYFNQFTIYFRCYIISYY